MIVNDRPRLAPCPACQALVFTAWRDGVLETVRVDPVALTALGELQAVMAGRRTFAHWGGAGGALDTRRPASILRWPAGGREHPIRPEHRCGLAPPDHLAEPAARPTDTEPPF